MFRRTVLTGVAALALPMPARAQAVTKEMVAAALPKLKEFAQQIIDKKLVPGLSVGIVHRDDVVWLDAHGETIDKLDEVAPVVQEGEKTALAPSK